MEFLLPYATLEPVRAVLMQGLAGEMLGRNRMWEEHLAREMKHAQIELTAVLHEGEWPMQRMMNLKVGDTLMFDKPATAALELRCGDLPVTKVSMGKCSNKLAVKVLDRLRRPSISYQTFEREAQGPSRS